MKKKKTHAWFWVWTRITQCERIPLGHIILYRGQKSVACCVFSINDGDWVTFWTFSDVLIDFHVQYFSVFAIRVLRHWMFAARSHVSIYRKSIPIGAIWTSGDLHSFLLANGLQIQGTLGLLPVNMDLFLFFIFFFVTPCACVFGLNTMNVDLVPRFFFLSLFFFNPTLLHHVYLILACQGRRQIRNLSDFYLTSTCNGIGKPMIQPRCERHGTLEAITDSAQCLQSLIN